MSYARWAPRDCPTGFEPVFTCLSRRFQPAAIPAAQRLRI
jgi:hypothetical protein